jgi:aspartate/methionine/tyrosine aminotransferase
LSLTSDLSQDIIHISKIQLEHKVQGLKNSDTLAINELVKQRQAAGLEVYNFGLGQAPFPIPDTMKQTLVDNAARTDYTPSAGIYSLREAIAKFHGYHFEHQVNPSQIIVGPGSKELLLNTMQILDSDWMIPSPHWVTYPHQVKMAGKQLFRCLLEEKTAYRITADLLRWKFDEISDDLNSKHLTILLNYPNNPTGLTIGDDELQRIARFASNNEILILSDEIYGNLNFEQNHNSIAKFYPEGTITTSGLSKDRSAGGWRVGVAILPDQLELINTYRAWASESYSCIPDMLQHAAIAGYQVNSEISCFMQDSATIHQLIAEFAYERLIKAGYHVGKPEGGFYIFPRLNQLRYALQEKGIFSSNDLCNHLMGEYHVATLPGTSFGLDPSELVFRLAMVGYDGDRVMQAFQEGLFDEYSLPEYCPNLWQGIQKLMQFVQTMQM